MYLKVATKGLLSKRKDASSWDTLASVLALVVFALSFRTGVVEERRILLYLQMTQSCSGLQGMFQNRIKIQMTLVHWRTACIKKKKKKDPWLKFRGTFLPSQFHLKQRETLTSLQNAEI